MRLKRTGEKCVMTEVGVGRLPPLFILPGVPHVDGGAKGWAKNRMLGLCTAGTLCTRQCNRLNNAGRTVDPAFVKLRLKTRNVDGRY